MFPFIAFAQTDSLRFKLVNDLTRDIYRTYLDVDIAKAMCDTINNKMLAGKYDTTLNIDEFVYEVNTDLRKVSQDNHIMISPSHFKFRNYEYTGKIRYYNLIQWNRRAKRHNKKWKRLMEKYRNRTKYDMFSYGEIKILPGNIGYVEIKDFNNTSFIKKENRKRISIKSVFEFLKNTNSIIIDFRENLGGYIYLSAKLCSYFSKASDPYFITTESVFRYDSSEIKKEIKLKNKINVDMEVNKSLIGDKKIFILTSKRTFSAGELSTYKIKQFNSNTLIVGERTTGGGNGHYGGKIEKYYSAVIPCVKVFDEKNLNYTLEAKGIKPDVLATGDSAFLVAYNLSLPKIIDTTKSKIKYFKNKKPITDNSNEYFRKYYNDFVGDYRKITVTNENQKLFMTYDRYSKQLLVPESINFFATRDFQFVRFIRNTHNKVTEIQIRHKDGYLEKFSKK